MNQRLISISLLIAFFPILASGNTIAYRPSQPPIDWNHYQDEAVSLLQDYIRIDTANPPGNELAAAEFFHRLFDAADIPNRIYVFAPGRADFYAVLQGDGALRPLILLNHMDVVGADGGSWTVPPFSGEIVKGNLYGRGAIDMKDEGLLQAMVLLIAARQHLRFKRDLVFLATADEEVDDQGSVWLLAHHPELVANAKYLITEGGSNLKYADHETIYGIGVAEKAPLWIRLTAHGRGGHGSIPLTNSAPNQLIRALNRIVDWEPPVRLIPAVEKYFRNIAQLEQEPLASEFRRIQKSIRNPDFVEQLTENERFNYQIRDTISLTMLRAGEQPNVIPGKATAQLDARLLPGETPQQFIDELRSVIDNDQIDVQPIGPFRTPNSSSTHTQLYRIIKQVVHQNDPHALVTPVLNSGYTESQMYRLRGIICYGFSPVVVTPEVEATEHAANEHVPVDQIRSGVRMLFEIVTKAANQ
jgi:acetylornithine deacetylase/succinyl-diaminopimelate desuccinylase-like protein